MAADAACRKGVTVRTGTATVFSGAVSVALVVPLVFTGCAVRGCRVDGGAVRGLAAEGVDVAGRWRGHDAVGLGAVGDAGGHGRRKCLRRGVSANKRTSKGRSSLARLQKEAAALAASLASPFRETGSVVCARGDWLSAGTVTGAGGAYLTLTLRTATPLSVPTLTMATPEATPVNVCVSWPGAGVSVRRRTPAVV